MTPSNPDPNLEDFDGDLRAAYEDQREELNNARRILRELATCSDKHVADAVANKVRQERFCLLC